MSNFANWGLINYNGKKYAAWGKGKHLPFKLFWNGYKNRWHLKSTQKCKTSNTSKWTESEWQYLVPQAAVVHGRQPVMDGCSPVLTKGLSGRHRVHVAVFQRLHHRLADFFFNLCFFFFFKGKGKNDHLIILCKNFKNKYCLSRKRL